MPPMLEEAALQGDPRLGEGGHGPSGRGDRPAGLVVVHQGRSLIVARRTGKTAIEDIQLEGGIVVHVTLDKESGTFHARYDEIFKGDNIEHHGGESWQNKDLKALRTEVRQWCKEKIRLQWEPIIVIYPNGGRSHSSEKEVLGCRFERLMRAKKLKGDEYEWRSWAYTNPNGSFVTDNDLDVYGPGGNEGQPTAFRSYEDPPVIIPYMPERWLALFKIIDMEKTLRRKLRDIINAGESKIDAFLGRVSSTGLLAFTPKDQP
jgi:hypothetical protein